MWKLCIKISLTILFLSPTMSIHALETHFSDQRLSDIESYIKKGMNDENIPGVSIALIEAGKVVYIKGFGKADNQGNSITPQTPFQLASMTKSFSALLILQLAEDGKLSLEDKVVDHIAWFSTANKSQSDKITIRQLLQHNSGLSTQSGNYTQNSQYRGVDATERSVKGLRKTQLVSTPGSRFEYSNSNYHIVSHLIEVLEGQPYEVVMDKRILQPLGMLNSYVQFPMRKTAKPAIGFPQWFGFSVERDFTLGRMKMGDGGLSASAEDLTKYLLEVSNGASGLVSKDMRDNLLNNDQNNGTAYGLGWEISKSQDAPLYEHGGNNGGFSNQFGFADANDQRADIAFVILTNSSSALHHQFIWNVRRTILGSELMQKKLNTVNLISLIVMYGSILVLLICLYRTLKTNKPSKVSIKHFIVPACLITNSYVMAYVVPATNKINLLSIYPFFPDLAVGLIGCSILSVLLGLVMLIKLSKFWKKT